MIADKAVVSRAADLLRIDRLWNAADPQLRRMVSLGLLFKARNLLARNRVTEAIEVGGLLLVRFADDPDDPDEALERTAPIVVGHLRQLMRVGGPSAAGAARLVLIARLLRSSALIGLGHFRQGFRVFEEIIERDLPGAVQAFQQLADEFARGGSTSDQVGAVTMLSMRADALGEGDRRIARIAYDDSLTERALDTRPLAVKLTARAMRPRTWLQRAR